MMASEERIRIKAAIHAAKKAISRVSAGQGTTIIAPAIEEGDQGLDLVLMIEENAEDTEVKPPAVRKDGTKRIKTESTAQRTKKRRNIKRADIDHLPIRIRDY